MGTPSCHSSTPPGDRWGSPCSDRQDPAAHRTALDPDGRDLTTPRQHTASDLDSSLWGKKQGLKDGPYPVACHLLDTSAIFLELWERTFSSATQHRIAQALQLPEQSAARELAYWAGLHDIGKISPAFQDPAHAAEEEDCDRKDLPGHDMITQWTLPAALEQLGYTSGSGSHFVAERLSAAIGQLLGGHHGRFHAALKKCEFKDPESLLAQSGHGSWREQRLEHARALRSTVAGGIPVPEGILPPELAVVVLGAVMVADWMASDTLSIEKWRRSAEEHCLCKTCLAGHWERVRKEAPTLVDKYGLGRTQFSRSPVTCGQTAGKTYGAQIFEEGFPSMMQQGAAPIVVVSVPDRQVRRKLGLHAAAVLGRATGARGLNLAVSSTAVAEEIRDTVDAFARDALDGTVLSRQLQPLAGPDSALGIRDVVALSMPEQQQYEAREWLAKERRGPLAAVSMSTLDRYLAAVLPFKNLAVRMFGLVDKVLVVEDALDRQPWQHQLLCRLLEWLGALRAPVVLLTERARAEPVQGLLQAYRSGTWVSQGRSGLPAPSDVSALPVHGYVCPNETTDALHVVRGSHEPGTRPELRIQIKYAMSDEEKHAVLRNETDHMQGQGRVLVCCATVEEAQRAYGLIDSYVSTPGKAPSPLRHALRIGLLHPRMPRRKFLQLRREIRENHSTAHLDPPGSILVATPAALDGLDLDFDRVVAGLMPMGDLLAVLAHCCRGGLDGRPAWVGQRNGTVVVVASTEERAGRSGEIAELERRTRACLQAVPKGLVRLPHDAVDLIAKAYRTPSGSFDEERRFAHGQLAETTPVPAPSGARDLYQLSKKDQGSSEEMLAEQMGRETGRIVCVRKARAGSRHFLLDCENVDEAVDVPTLVRPGKAKTEEQQAEQASAIAMLVDRAVPVPSSWIDRRAVAEQPAEEKLSIPHWDDVAVLQGTFPVLMHETASSTQQNRTYEGMLGNICLRLSNYGLQRLG